MRTLYVLGILTVSFDVFLVFNLGFNFRAAQIFLAVPILLGMLKAVDRTKWPLGFTALIVWSVFILAFIPNTEFLMRSVGYGFWLLFSVALVFATVQLYSSVLIFTLLRWYIYSFFFVGLFGLFQFALPLVGITPPLVAQWWIPGILARINGFSYEPSYFATYLIMGWVMVMYLMEKRHYFLPKKRLLLIAVILTLAIILSSSRMGLAMMGLWVLRYPLIAFGRLLLLKTSRYARYSFALVGVSLVLLGVFVSVGGLEALFLLEGTGIGDSSSHSVSERWQGLSDVLAIFHASPIVGYSLGGLSPAIGALNDVDVTDLETAKQFEGLGVFPQVLAASGLIGFIPFAMYIFALVVKPYRLSANVPEKLLLRALVYALVFELLILQFNQNILRPYLWLHIALLSALYAQSSRHLSTIKKMRAPT